MNAPRRPVTVRAAALRVDPAAARSARLALTLALLAAAMAFSGPARSQLRPTGAQPTDTIETGAGLAAAASDGTVADPPTAEQRLHDLVGKITTIQYQRETCGDFGRSSMDCIRFERQLSQATKDVRTLFAGLGIGPTPATIVQGCRRVASGWPSGQRHWTNADSCEQVARAAFSREIAALVADSDDEAGARNN